MPPCNQFSFQTSLSLQRSMWSVCTQMFVDWVWVQQPPPLSLSNTRQRVLSPLKIGFWGFSLRQSFEFTWDRRDRALVLQGQCFEFHCVYGLCFLVLQFSVPDPICGTVKSWFHDKTIHHKNPILNGHNVTPCIYCWDKHRIWYSSKVFV